MMTAEDIVATLVAARTDEIVISTMSGYGVWGAGGERDFRLVGLMGAAASIGLGVAAARPDERVWVLDGDGSLMMQLGVLPAVADARPANYVHVVLDNRVYGVSGAQPLPAHERFDWVASALAAGYPAAVACATTEELRAALTSGDAGPRMVVARCEPRRPAYRPGVFTIDASEEGVRLREVLAREDP